MTFFPHFRLGLFSTALLLTTALAIPALAENLPEISPRQIANDVELRYNPDTGVREYTAPTFDPFEEDETMAGTANLRSVSNAVTIDGQPLRGGALLDLTFYYSSPTSDPYDVRGFEEAVFLSDDYAPVTLRDSRVLDCSEKITETIYHHDNYYSPSLYSGFYRPYRHYGGHYRFSNSVFGGPYGYAYRRGIRGYNSYNIRRNRNRSGIFGGVRRDIKRGLRTQRDRDDMRDRRRDDDRRSRDRRREDDRSRERRDRDGDRSHRRRGRGNGNPTATNRDGIAATPRVDRRTTPRTNRRNGRTGRNIRADRAPNTDRTPRTNRRELTPDNRSNPRRRVTTSRNELADRNARTDRNTQPRITRDGRARGPRADNRRLRRNAPPSAATPRATPQVRTPRAVTPNRPAPTARPVPAPRPAPAARRSSPPKKAPVTRQYSPPKKAPAARRPARVNRAVDKAFRRKNPSRSIRNSREFFPKASSASRRAVTNVDTQCAREERLTVHIPQERLDASRFDGLTVLVLDRAGREIPVYIPPNYVEGFRLAAGSTVSSVPSGTYTAPHDAAPVYRESYPPTRIETAPCPAGTTKQPDGTCLTTATTYGGYPRP